MTTNIGDVKLSTYVLEASWKFIKDTINTGIESFIPKVLRRRNNHHQWMTKTVKQLVRKKQRDYNSYMQTRTQEYFTKFKETEKKCKKAIRSAKRKFERDIAKNGNKRPFNSYIKSRTSSRINIGPLKDGDKLVSDNLEMATILNKTFSAVFTQEDRSNIPQCAPVNNPSSIEDIFFDPA